MVYTLIYIRCSFSRISSLNTFSMLESFINPLFSLLIDKKKITNYVKIKISPDNPYKFPANPSVEKEHP